MNDAAESKHLFEPTGDFQCLHEFIPAARAKLSDHIWGYLVGAAQAMVNSPGPGPDGVLPTIGDTA